MNAATDKPHWLQFGDGIKALISAMADVSKVEAEGEALQTYPCVSQLRW